MTDTKRTDFEAQLETRYATTPAQMHAMVKEVFLWMYDKGVDRLTIKRYDKKAVIEVSCEPLPPPPVSAGGGK